MGSLVEPIELAGRHAPSRLVFGPHETNLGRRRGIGDRHVAYYRARAAGGAGIVVTETASVHPSDWPYERAPLAADCRAGWDAVADACHRYGTLVLAGLGHAGGQGSSAYSQSVLWAPSRVADAISREAPMAMEPDHIDEIVAGFGDAARVAVASGLDGVEIDAGPQSLLRQFHSGLTNLRTDEYGADRLLLTRRVLAATRAALGDGPVLALRLSCDELAPWAGVTPEQAVGQVEQVAGSVDLLTVLRGGPYSVNAYRPDAHVAPTFNLELCRRMREAAAGRVPVVLQGSVVDPDAAQAALDTGAADLVEMTRAQIADPRLASRVRSGVPGRVRPCILCNQACRVRDSRNPVVSCVGEPRSGHETEEPDVDDEQGADPGPEPGAGTRPPVVVVGAGVAGLECARVLARRGHRVRVVERGTASGGAVRAAARGPGRERMALLAAWLAAECAHAGVAVELGTEAHAPDLDRWAAEGSQVVLATGSRPAPFTVGTDPGPGPGGDRSRRGDPGEAPDAPPPVVDALSLLAGTVDALPDGPVVVHDPVGGPVGVGVAEWLAAAGRQVALVTPDQIAGTLLSLSGDLADANTRLQRAGVRRELRALLRDLRPGRAELEDVWTGERRQVACAALVDCGHRLPEERLYGERPGTARAGDCVAPRTILEAVLEGRRRALELSASAHSPVGGSTGDAHSPVGGTTGDAHSPVGGTPGRAVGAGAGR